MKKLILFLSFTFFILLQHTTRAQSVGINNTGAEPHISAILDLQSTDKGLLVPRMTQAQRFAITAPAAGLMVYQTDQEKGFYYNSNAPLLPVWKKVGSEALPKGMIVMSDSFPNSIMTANGFLPVGTLQQASIAPYGDYGRWTSCNTTNSLQMVGKGIAVWTGTEVLYWNYSDAKRYNPATDTWATIPANPLLAGRRDVSFVWTGTELIIWGGELGPGNYFNTGARYNPSTNTWQNMSTANAPIARSSAKAYWTGTEVIFFGGFTAIQLSDGAKYNPATNTWTTMATANGPGNRKEYAFGWTGSKLLVWGGREGSQVENDGYIYNPIGNSWSLMPALNAPSARMDMFYVWTGTELLIWGGYNEVLDQGCNCMQPSYRTDGAKFNPASLTWSPISNQFAPSPASSYATEFAGGCWMFFYKGGKVYNVATNTWSALDNPGVQIGDYGPNVVKAIGNKIMVWGSSDDIAQKASQCHPVGGVWDPFTNEWTMVNENEAPLRSSATPVWTGTELFVASSPLADDPAGAVVVSRYNPSQQGFGQAATKTLYLYKKN